MPLSPIIPTFRLVFKYTVLSFQHKLQLYLDAVVSGDSLGYDAVARGGFSNPGLSAVEPAVWNSIKALYRTADTTFDSMTLEQRTGTIWNYVASIAATIGPSGTNVAQKAMMYCLSGKSLGNENMPIYIYELNPGLPGKINSYGGLGADVQTFVDAFWNITGSATDAMPVAWRLSRDGGYSGRWIAAIWDSNEKLRRLRRIK